MNAYPFSLFKRADRPFYLVSFKDDHGNFLSPLSTKKKTEQEALQVAFQWLRDGIPQKQDPEKIQRHALKDMARKIETVADAEIVLNELVRSGLIKSYVLADTQAAKDFNEFLIEFWNWEVSPYIQEKRRKVHGIHKRHCHQQGQIIARYWLPFFEGRVLGDITAKDVDAFITRLADKPISAARKNLVIKAGTKALRWAFSKGLIGTDPTRGHIMYAGEENKRDILSPTVAAAFFRAPWKDERAKLANMLASVTGMRAGEIQALRFQDLGTDCLYVRNSWNSKDGLKPPKTTSAERWKYPSLILCTG